MNIIILDYCSGRTIRVKVNNPNDKKKFIEDADLFMEELAKRFHFRVKDASWMSVETEDFEIEEYII